MRIVRWTGRHWMMGWVLALLPLAWLAADREPPFAITGPVQVENARAGEKMRIVAPVRRDVDRDCHVTWVRYIIDGQHVRHDFLEPERFMSAEGLRQQHAAMGPYLRLAVDIPRGAAPGQSSYQVSLEYVCNPTHWIVPIRVHMRVDFEVLP